MGTFRFYKYAPLPSFRQWLARGVLMTALFAGATKWDLYEDRQIIGSMHDKTYLYHGYYKKQENQPYKPTFKRIE